MILPVNGNLLTSFEPTIPTGKILHFVNFAKPAKPLFTPLISPAEFVAETFSLKVQGTPIPKEVETLYQKYGGPKVG